MVKEKISAKLFWSLFVVYTIGVFSKTSFSAATVILIGENILTKTQAGLISGLFWLIYALIQVVSGKIVTKFSPYILICINLIVSAMSNIAISMVDDFVSMLIIWNLGAVCQFMWPAILKLIATEILPFQRQRSLMYLSYCYCLGSIFSYALTTVILACFNWKVLFAACGVVTALSVIPVFNAMVRYSPFLSNKSITSKSNVVANNKGKITLRIILDYHIILFCILILFKNTIETGMKNWMPTMLVEIYDGSASYTSFLMVLTLAINVLGVFICNKLYVKFKYNEVACLFIMFLVALPATLLLLSFENCGIYICTILMCVITCIFYGSGQLINVNYPANFQSLGLMPFVGGVINCFASIGNVVASYGCGYVADNFGWKTMIVLWNILVAIMFFITIYLLKSRFIKKNIDN